ncbi:MAG: M28 family peptidase [Acidobacteriota bacterium]|nr:M28 family peptidase [Acidobacteriota bacterium]
MAAVPPAPRPARRPRPGSLERPVNGRLYRGTWLLVGLPLLVLAFSVARPSALQPPNLPPAFDRTDARALAAQLAIGFPSRIPGTGAANAAARWFGRELTPYGYAVEREPFTATVPGRGRVSLLNLMVEKRGLSHKTIVVLAHRDDAGVGPGANDNASGTAALLELARAYAPAGGAAQLTLPYSLLFLSTDGGVYGGLGAAEFAARAPQRQDVIAVIDLDAIAGHGRPRLVLTGDTPRTPAVGLVETVRAQLAAETGSDPGRASALRQLVDLGFPFSPYEQAPFVARGVPAVTITTAPDRPPSGIGDGPGALDVARLGQIGRATQNVVDALEQGIALSPGPSSYVYLGSRIIRGWAIEIVLVAMLLPFLVAAVDLFARCRRRHIRIAPAFRSYRTRLAFWAWCGALFALFAAAGALPGGAPRPPLLTNVHWPQAATFGLLVLAALGWLVARDRLTPRRAILPEEILAGHAGALIALAVVALLVVATNPFALVFILPSLHVWLWLPQVRGRALALRAAVLVLGFAGPALLVFSFATRYGLGLDAPWYIAWLYALRYAPAPGFLVALAWTAGAGQLVALSAGRYAPYPAAAERPPRGPIRETVRRVVLARRRHASETARRALHG